MKILHCLRSFFPDKSAGIEIYVAGLCNGLQLLDIEVAVIKPSFDKGPEEYIYNGIRVIQYWETSKATPELQAGLKAPDGIMNFRKLLLKEKPDAVHFHEMAGSNGITIYHVIAAKEMSFPIFTTFHLAGNICMRNTFLYKNKYACNGIINEYKCAVCMLQKKGLIWGVPEVISFFGKHFKKNISLSGPGKMFNYPLYIKHHASQLHRINLSSEKMFVLSNWYKSLLVSNGLDKNKIIVLPVAIPVNNPKGFEKKNKIAIRDKVRLVYAGRISQIKGLHILLKAILNLEQTNWELDIYGAVYEDEYFSSCKKLTANNSSIKWKGVIAHDTIISTLSEYDAMIFPSIVQETMGLVVLESLAAGVPVIASSLWSVSEQIDDGVNGLLFKTGSIQSLKEVLSKVLKDPSLLIKLSANIKAPEYINAVAAATAGIYNEILNYKVKGV